MKREHVSIKLGLVFVASALLVALWVVSVGMLVWNAANMAPPSTGLGIINHYLTVGLVVLTASVLSVLVLFGIAVSALLFKAAFYPDMRVDYAG